MEYSESTQSDEVDELLIVLASDKCRATLLYLQNQLGDVSTLDDLASYLQKQDHGGSKEIATELHHSVIPRLKDVGAIEYDRVSKEIQYKGHSELERVLES